MKNFIKKYTAVKSAKLELLQNSYNVYYLANKHGLAGNGWFVQQEKFMSQFLFAAMNEEVHGSMHDYELMYEGEWVDYINMYLRVIKQCYATISTAPAEGDIKEKVEATLKNYLKEFCGEGLYDHLRYVLEEFEEWHYQQDCGNDFAISYEMIEYSFYSYNLDLVNLFWDIKD